MEAKTFTTPQRKARTAPRLIGSLAVLALFGATAQGHAEDQRVEMAASSDAALVSSSANTPAFTPSDDAVFAEAFAQFDTPAETELPAHAVDITTIEPAAPASTSLGTGMASYYGRQFQGRPTASGERFDMNGLTAAHRTLPFGSRVRVTNPRNGESVVVRINDRGPFIRGRDIDLSRAAAEEIGIIRAGHGSVELELLDS